MGGEVGSYGCDAISCTPWTVAILFGRAAKFLGDGPYGTLLETWLEGNLMKSRKTIPRFLAIAWSERDVHSWNY